MFERILVDLPAARIIAAHPFEGRVASGWDLKEVSIEFKNSASHLDWAQSAPILVERVAAKYHVINGRIRGYEIFEALKSQGETRTGPSPTCISDRTNRTAACL